MVLKGTMTNGVVVLDAGMAVPDGTRVEVTVPLAEAKAAPSADKPTMSWLLEFSGVVDDLPPDFADQHDHYIHGTPKR